MPVGTDRGIAFIKTNNDGTNDVYIASDTDDSGAPQDVFAIHRNRDGVDLLPGVKMIPAGKMRRTEGVVTVALDSSRRVVQLIPQRKDLGRLLEG
jgi:hypothetical protein